MPLDQAIETCDYTTRDRNALAIPANATAAKVVADINSRIAPFNTLDNLMEHNMAIFCDFKLGRSPKTKEAAAETAASLNSAPNQP